MICCNISLHSIYPGPQEHVIGKQAFCVVRIRELRHLKTDPTPELPRAPNSPKQGLGLRVKGLGSVFVDFKPDIR